MLLPYLCIIATNTTVLPPCVVVANSRVITVNCYTQGITADGLLGYDSTSNGLFGWGTEYINNNFEEFVWCLSTISQTNSSYTGNFYVSITNSTGSSINNPAISVTIRAHGTLLVHGNYRASASSIISANSLSEYKIESSGDIYDEGPPLRIRSYSEPKGGGYQLMGTISSGETMQFTTGDLAGDTTVEHAD